MLLLQKPSRKERGRVELSAVSVVEAAQLNEPTEQHPQGVPFQLVYSEAGQEYTLYLLAPREHDRTDWIRAIRAGLKYALSNSYQQHLTTALLPF